MAKFERFTDLIDDYNNNIDVCLESLLATIVYKGHNTQEIYNSITKEIDGINWVIETLEKAKDKLEAIQEKMEEE